MSEIFKRHPSINRLIVVFIFLIGSSCSGQRLLPRQVAGRMVPSHFKQLKEVEKSLSDSIGFSSRLIYVYMPEIKLPMASNGNFIAAIYSPENLKSFLFEKDKSKVNKIVNLPVRTEPGVFRFILKNYLENKVNYLDSVQIHNISEGGINLIILYDIDLKQSIVKKFEWENILVDKKGNLTTLRKYMTE